MSRTAAVEWDGLLKGEAAGEPDALFVLLVERQSRFVFRIAYAMLRNVEDAEDIVQETFLKLFRTGAWRKIEDEKAYLARVAWRLASTRTAVARAGTAAELREPASAENDPERAAIDTEQSKTIHRLIDTLPEKLRGPLALSSTGEMTASQIAVVMNLPEGTVRRLLAEARALLKRKLASMEGRNHA